MYHRCIFFISINQIVINFFQWLVRPDRTFSEKNEDYIENESNTFMLSKKLVSKIKQRIDGLNDLYKKDNYSYSSNPDYCY